jgi:hypothetical protein
MYFHSLLCFGEAFLCWLLCISVLEDWRAGRKQRALKEKAWLIVTACHAGCLADNRMPVGSGSAPRSCPRLLAGLGQDFFLSLALSEEDCVAYSAGGGTDVPSSQYSLLRLTPPREEEGRTWNQSRRQSSVRARKRQTMSRNTNT